MLTLTKFFLDVERTSMKQRKLATRKPLKPIYWDPGYKRHRKEFILILKNCYINYPQIETHVFISIKEVYILDISTIMNVFVFSMSDFERETKVRDI